MRLFSFFRNRKHTPDIKDSRYRSEKIVVEDKSGSCSDSRDIEESNTDEFIQRTEDTKAKLNSIRKIIEGLQQRIRYEDLEAYDPTLDLSHYTLPSSTLLKVYETKNTDTEAINTNKSAIISTLQTNNIEVESIRATVGRINTLYEVQPKAGTRITKIRQAKEDLALALRCHNLTLEPIFENGAIGISIPNEEPQILPLLEIISSQDFIESTYELPIILGKTDTNQNLIIDLAQTPHMLIAGATGQGKSVLLNVIITSLLYKKHPAEIKLILIDPRMIEFGLYSVIEKHYLAKLPDSESAIVTEYNKAIQTLNGLQIEMGERYNLLSRAGVRNINDYNIFFKKRKLNPRQGHRFIPRIVLVIDEYSDLIMMGGKEIELPLVGLTRQARAIGIHLILSTQRPTEKIITGNLKSNFFARVAFKVASRVDSRIILDKNGAEDLSGTGDALYDNGISTTRIQVPYISTAEIQEITNYIGEQQGYSSAFDLPEFTNSFDDGVSVIDLNDRDALFEEAARLIVVHQLGSTSLIQRKFSIGYNRTGRIMDQLEAAGIVGSALGSKPRDVLIMDEHSLDKLFATLD